MLFARSSGMMPSANDPVRAATLAGFPGLARPLTLPGLEVRPP